MIPVRLSHALSPTHFFNTNTNKSIRDDPSVKYNHASSFVEGSPDIPAGVEWNGLSGSISVSVNVRLDRLLAVPPIECVSNGSYSNAKIRECFED